jgi:hypothetical protein
LAKSFYTNGYESQTKVLLQEGLDLGSFLQDEIGGNIAVKICISLAELSLLEDLGAKILPIELSVCTSRIIGASRDTESRGH